MDAVKTLKITSGCEVAVNINRIVAYLMKVYAAE